MQSMKTLRTMLVPLVALLALVLMLAALGARLAGYTFPAWMEAPPDAGWATEPRAAQD